MKKVFLLIPLSILLSAGNNLFSQPTLSFNKTFGSSGYEGINDIAEGGDGKIVLLCYATKDSGDVNCNFKGGSDVWLVCIDATGNILWQQCYGGSDDEIPHRIVRTNDYGFLFTASTFSNDGDVSGNHGASDVWVVKLDSMGLLQWQRCIGSTAGEDPEFSMELANGKYLITCITLGNNGDFPVHYGGYFNDDAWVVILNMDGSLDSSYHYGGSQDDFIKHVIELPNGDRMMFGYTASSDYDLSSTVAYGNNDGWIFKTDSIGNMLWQNRWGGTNSDGYISAVQMNDGGYLIGGTSSSTGGDFTSNHGAADLWLVKVNSLGDKQWQKLYGGSGSESGDFEQRLAKVNSNLFTMGGWTDSNDGDVGINLGQEDYWFISVDSLGNIISKRVSGGTDNDYMLVNAVFEDNPYQGGVTESNDYDILYQHGLDDAWFIQFTNFELVGELNVEESCVKIYPNPLHAQFYIDACSSLLAKKAILEIYSVTGDEIMHKKIYKNHEEILIPELAIGTYVYELTNEHGDKVMSGKLIVK